MFDRAEQRVGRLNVRRELNGLLQIIPSRTQLITGNGQPRQTQQRPGIERLALEHGRYGRLRLIKPAPLDQQFCQAQTGRGQIATQFGGAAQTRQRRLGIVSRPRQPAQVRPAWFARLKPFRLRETQVGFRKNIVNAQHHCQTPPSQS